MLVDRVCEGYFSAATRTNQPEVVGAFREVLRACSGAALGHATQSVLVDRTSILDQLGELAIPTLFVASTDDAGIRMDVAQATAGRINEVQFEVVEGAGHLTPLERPQAFNMLLRSFLADDDAGVSAAPESTED